VASAASVRRPGERCEPRRRQSPARVREPRGGRGTRPPGWAGARGSARAGGGVGGGVGGASGRRRWGSGRTRFNTPGLTTG